MMVSDVVIQILSKLPLQSLLRFKSVCKSWYALINDHKFVTKHLLHSFPQKHVLFKRAIIDNSGEEELVFSILEFSLDRSVSVLDIHLPFQKCNHFLQLYGHSHGLVCLSDRLDETFLVNPTTRQFRKLPPSILTNFSYHHPDAYYAEPTTIGFGYDSKSSDFKVVRLLCCSEFNSKVSCRPPCRGEIYDLSKDKWREIEAPSFCLSAFNNASFNMYHEGTFYWWGYGGLISDHEVDRIITFDMSEEVFGQISVPESYDKRKHNTSLRVWNRSIVLFIYPFVSNETNIDIWEMEKDESSVVSWSKLLTIDPLLRIELPLLFVSCEELLMESIEGRVIMYNSKTQRFKKFPIEGEKIATKRNRFEATPLIKSLVSVEGGIDMSYNF